MGRHILFVIQQRLFKTHVAKVYAAISRLYSQARVLLIHNATVKPVGPW